MAVISGDITEAINLVDTLAAGANRPTAIPFLVQFRHSLIWANGTGAGQGNRIFYLADTAVASTPYIINLSTIVCIDGSVGMTHVRDGLIPNDAIIDGRILTYGGGTTPFQPFLAGTTPTLIIPAGGVFRIPPKPLGTLGYVVSTAVNIKLDPGAVDVPFRILLLGSS